MFAGDTKLFPSGIIVDDLLFDMNVNLPRYLSGLKQI